MFDFSLPIHPITGLRAIGVVGGKPVWPILGGSGEGGDGGTGGEGGENGTGGEGGDDEKLGEPGKKALQAERTRANEAEKARDALNTELDTLRKQVQAIEDSKLDDTQKLQRDADSNAKRVGELETENTALQQANQRLLIAIEEKVPADWVARIQGATPDEMRADAQKIKSSLRDDSAGDHTPGAGHRGGDVVETAPGIGTLRAAYEQSARK